MKLRANQLTDTISKAGKSVFAYLFYGADLGAIRHGADEVISFIKKQDAQTDVVILTSEALKENPYRLKEEGASNSLFASKRVLWLKNPSDNLLDELDEYLTNSTADTPVLIITSDSFNTKSKTVTLFNDLPNACALGFYLEEGAQLRQTISQNLQNNGFTILPEALSFLMESLGADKGPFRFPDQ